MRISDWSSDVCSSDLEAGQRLPGVGEQHVLDEGDAAGGAFDVGEDDGVHVSRDSGFWIRDSGFGIRDWGLGIAEIRLRESLIPNPESPPCRNAGISARCRCR